MTDRSADFLTGDYTTTKPTNDKFLRQLTASVSSPHLPLFVRTRNALADVAIANRNFLSTDRRDPTMMAGRKRASEEMRSNSWHQRNGALPLRAHA